MVDTKFSVFAQTHAKTLEPGYSWFYFQFFEFGKTDEAGESYMQNFEMIFLKNKFTSIGIPSKK